jgi:lysine-specific histone demethylase 1
MSDKEADTKPKRVAEATEDAAEDAGAGEEEKRTTRKKPRVDYSEDKKVSADPKSGKSPADQEPSKPAKEGEQAADEAGSSPTKPDDLLGLPVEQSGLEGAAFQSRMPFDKMTQVEAACFPDLVTPLQSQKLYLHIRNRLLQVTITEWPRALCNIDNQQKFDEAISESHSQDELRIAYPSIIFS